MASGTAPDYKFFQVFGEEQVDGAGIEEIQEADLLSALDFDETGDYLATGDRGGRIVVFERAMSDKAAAAPSDLAQRSGKGAASRSKANAQYRFLTEFQSHEPEFDYLKSLDIEEKINQIKWLNRCNSSHFLLTTNDKTIKLWKVGSRAVYGATEPTADSMEVAGGGVQVPRLQRFETRTESSPKRVFANAHAYHINSISVNCDDETFISADDLRINLWNTSVNDQSFNIVDIKPPNMEDLAEVITSARFHPSMCSVFAYSSSKGAIRLCDMRARALCDVHSKAFEEPIDPASKSFFSEIISSISDIKFSHSGRYFLSRDFMTVKIWDTHMEGRPVSSFGVHEYLRPKLCDLYENDCIFDKFEASWSPDDRQVLAGTYHNLFRVHDIAEKRSVLLEASRDNIMGPSHTLTPISIASGAAKPASRHTMHVGSLNHKMKIMHAAWHPTRPILALAATNNLYLYRR